MIPPPPGRLNVEISADGVGDPLANIDPLAAGRVIAGSLGFADFIRLRRIVVVVKPDALVDPPLAIAFLCFMYSGESFLANVSSFCSETPPGNIIVVGVP